MRDKLIMFSSVGPWMEQLCVNKSPHKGSRCEFFKRRDRVKSTSLKQYFSKFFVESQTNKTKYIYLKNSSGCL